MESPQAMRLDFSDPTLYNPVYIPLLYDARRYLFLMGGSGSGKSTFQAQKEIIKTFEPGNRLMAVRKVKDTLKDSVFAELCGVVGSWGLGRYFEITKSPMYIRNRLTGSDVIFRGIDDPEKIKSIQGVNRTWVEEATELAKKDFDQIDLRLRGKTGMQITCTFNPIDEEHWLNADFWAHGSTDEVGLLHTTYQNNRWVGPEYRRVMDRLREQDPRMWEIYALGKWGKAAEGLVFSFHDIPAVPDEARLLAYGQDFGFTNDPSALVAVYAWDGTLVFDEIFYQTGLTNSDIAGLYRSHGIQPEDEVFADSSEPKSIEEIYRYGFNIHPVEKGPDSVIFGINLMKQQPIHVTARSVNLKKELRKYVWKKDKEGKSLNVPIDAFNHAIDAARYAVMMKLRRDEVNNGIYVI